GDRPLPGGTVQLYQADSAGRLQLLGEARSEHTAPGRDLRVQSGDAFDITAERVQTDYAQEQLAPPKRGMAPRQRLTVSYKVDLEREACARDGRRARSAVRRVARDREQRSGGKALRHGGPVPDLGSRERGRNAHLHRPGRIVTVQLLHFSDLHFGGLADPDQIE